MTRNIRRIKGWPIGAAPASSPATAAELARARQTGQTVVELRKEQARAEAAVELDAILMADKAGQIVRLQGQDAPARELGLTTKQRWALHVAVGVLKGGR